MKLPSTLCENGPTDDFQFSRLPAYSVHIEASVSFEILFIKRKIVNLNGALRSTHLNPSRFIRFYAA
jgi:hypothetical protein